MFKKINRAVVVAVLVVLSGTVFYSQSYAQTTAPVDSACEGLQQVDPTVTCDTDGSTNSFTAIMKSVIEILSIVIGAVSVLMIIIGGFKYVVSAGDSNGIQSAKNTILYALVGLVVAVFAQVIARFVLGQVK